MALGTGNISVTAIQGEIGSSAVKVSELVGAAGLNRYSFYAPGALSVDANHDVVLTPPTSAFKMGDYRSYNHASLTPAAATTFTQSYAPSLSTLDFTQPWFPQAMNIKAFAIPGDYVTFKYYLSEADRTNEANSIHTQTFPITYAGITPLSGHTRQVYYRANSTQTCTLTGFPLLGLSTPDDYVYCETYISDSSGNRVINLGVHANNYTTITFHKYNEPQITVGYNFTPLPAPISGVSWTFVAPMIEQSTTPCATTTPINMVQGSSTFTFYIKAKGVCATPNPGSMWVAGISSCDIILTVNGVDQTIATGASIDANTAGFYCDGTLSGGRTWQYDWTGRVRFENVVWSGVNLNCS